MTYIFSVKIINLEGLVSLFFSVILPPSGQELLSDTLKKDYFHHDMSSIILINGINTFWSIPVMWAHVDLVVTWSSLYPIF